MHVGVDAAALVGRDEDGMPASGIGGRAAVPCCRVVGKGLPRCPLRAVFKIVEEGHGVGYLGSGEMAITSKAAFQSLLLCDGITDVDSSRVDPVHRKLIQKFIDKNIVKKCENGERLLERQKYKYFDNEYVKMAHWSITGLCNFKCRHCFLSAPHKMYEDLSTEACLKIVDELAKCGIMQVSITGGEPLTCPDFFILLDAIREKGIVVTAIYTNGALVNKNLLNNFKKRKINPIFSISYDGIGWHDWMRGVKGAEKMAIQAIDLLHSEGFDVDVEMCIHKLNRNVFEKSINFLIKHGVGSVKVGPVENSGEWVKENKVHDLSRTELFDLYLEYIPKYLSSGSPISLQMGSFFICEKGSQEYRIPAKKFDGTRKTLKRKVCEHAKHNIYICPNGQLLPCMALGGVKNNLPKVYIYNKSLKEVLKSSDYLSLLNKTVGDLCENNPKCNSCVHKLACGGGCRANALMANNNEYLGCDRVSCDIFKKGYIEKIKQAARKGMLNISCAKT